MGKIIDCKLANSSILSNLYGISSIKSKDYTRMMEKMRNVLIVLGVMLFSIIGKAQTGVTEDFNDNILSGSWSNGSSYTLTETNQELRNVVNVASGAYSIFAFTIPSTDVSNDPYVKIKIKAPSNCKLRIDFEDVNGKATNSSAINLDVIGNNTYQTLTYNFTGRFNQSWPNTSTVDPTKIVKLVFFVNPGGSAYANTIYIDDVLIGSASGILPPPGDIKVNQIGYYPNADKIGIVVKNSSSPFYIISSDKLDTVFSGTTTAPASFAMTGENVCRADFSSFDSVGTFYLNVLGIGYSYPFEIKDQVLHAAAKAGIKAFYYQRASMSIDAPFAGSWPRAKGHPDNNVYVHNSAANSYRPTNTIISSPRGWYDAGDYNKYIVNAGITNFMLLSMYEHYPTYFDTLDLHIPESSNALPDVLDEVLYEVRWFLTMQDPYDGGVYSKLTSPNFDGTVMPSASTLPRYVVQKSTAATLDFAASMAQAARIYKLYEAQLPGLADSCINAAFKAWKWARRNPNIAYVQSVLTSPTINTGEYGDNSFSDEFHWAGMELFATTKIDSFYTLAGPLANFTTPGWANVRALGYYSLAHLRKDIAPLADTTTLKSKIIQQADYIKSRALLNPYRTTMYDSWAFNWGSNSTAAIHGFMLLHAFDLTKDSSYLDFAMANLDYLFGRNGVNYSFLTGFGDLFPMDVHHRIIAADGITAPIPGLLAGGPNTDAQSDCGAGSYPSTLKGKAYLDAYCSYSTNEIAINWNAPYAYLANVVEAIKAGGSSGKLSYTSVLPTDISVMIDNMTSISDADFQSKLKLAAYPNPAKEKLEIEFVNLSSVSEVSFLDGKGGLKFKKEYTANGSVQDVFDLSLFPKGLYFLVVKSGERTEARKIVVE